MEEEDDSVHAVSQIQQQGERERTEKKPGPVSVKDRDCKPAHAFRGEKYYKKGKH